MRQARHFIRSGIPSLLAILVVFGLTSGCGSRGKSEDPLKPINQSADRIHETEIDSNKGKAERMPTERAEGAPVKARAVRERPVRTRQDVKGIYVSAAVMHSPTRLRELIRLADETEINAFVIDVKSDWGRITYRSRVPIVRETKSDSHFSARKLKKLLHTLHDHKIYVIGRVVSFKDPHLASVKPEWAFQRKQGGVWRDNHGQSWVDPYRPEVRRYVIDVAKEAAMLGFDEIQFDYVRFPENGAKIDREIAYANPDNKSKAALIGEFLRQAASGLHAQGVPLSADVFGLTTSTAGDMGIGQQWGILTRTADVLSPMIYPSHYSPGMYQISAPDLHPSEIVEGALRDGLFKNRTVSRYSRHTAQIRPWLQDFTATWVHPHLTYGREQVREQVDAAARLGIHQYLLWNAGCRYSMEANLKNR